MISENVLLLLDLFNTDPDPHQFDVTIGQCVVSDRNPASAVHIRHETLSEMVIQSLSTPIATVCFVPLSQDSA